MITLVILATQEAEIGRIAAWSQPGKILLRVSKKGIKKRAGGVAWGVGLEFKPVPQKKKKKVLIIKAMLT
jgi:hypothetical protein